MRTRRLKVFLVDDHPVARAGWRSQIEGAVDVVGEADEAGAAIELILERDPDVVLLDVHLPGGGGERIAREVSRAEGSVRLLAVSASVDRADVVGVMAAGATGYIKKTALAGELLDAIAKVADGQPVFAAELAGIVMDVVRDPDVLDPDVAALTDRELDVLRQIALGLTYKEIGERLFISVKTVESHMSNILTKLQLTNRHALSRWAQERGLT